MYSVECARISFFTRLVQKGRIFRPCFLSSACFKHWATLSPSAKSENVFWYFSWRNFKAKCLIPLFRHYNLQVLYFCRNGEPVSKKEKENKPAQSAKKKNAQVKPATSQSAILSKTCTFDAELYGQQTFKSGLKCWSGFINPYSQRTLITLIISSYNVISQTVRILSPPRSSSFSRRVFFWTLTWLWECRSETPALWAPAQRKHAQHLGHPHLVRLASTSPRWRFMLLHIPFTLFCVISFVNANFQHSTFPFSQHIASKIPVCSSDYQKHVGMKSPDYSRRPSLNYNSSNQIIILYNSFNYFTTLTI